MPYVRLIFYGGARTESDNSAFLFGAKNVNKDYGGTAQINFAKDAQFIIDKINAQADNSVGSIDFFTHGSQYGLYMVKNGNTDASGEESDIPVDDVESNNLYGSSTLRYTQGMFGGSETGIITSFNYAKFTNNAKIEVHGCMSAGGTIFVDNIAINISQELYGAGKLRSVVIAHTTKSEPFNNGSKNLLSRLKSQDYRWKERAVFHNGSLLFKTSIKGEIKQNVIDYYLNQKENQGGNYDGSTQTYTKDTKIN